MQGMWIRSLVREDPTWLGQLSLWAAAAEPCSRTREATAMRGPSLQLESSPHSQQLEKTREQQQRLSAAKINNVFLKQNFYKK